MISRLAKKERLYYLSNVLLQSLIILFFYNLFIFLGLLYSGLALSSKLFDIITLIYEIIPWFLPSILFILFLSVFKTKLHYIKLIINSFILSILSIFLLDSIFYFHFVPCIIALILLSFLFRSQIQKLLIK